MIIESKKLILIIFISSSILIDQVYLGTSQYYYSIVKGYNVSKNVSSYLKKANIDRMGCLSICTSNPRCTLIYIDLIKKECTFYKIVSVDKFLVSIPTQSDSANSIIYRRKFKTGIKTLTFGGPPNFGGYSQFTTNVTINGNNPLTKIVLKCNSFLRQIDFVYADLQTFSYKRFTYSVISQYTIDLVNKEIVYVGHASGEIMDMLEFCTRDLTTSIITCTKGCATTLSSAQTFDLYEIVAFTGDFNSGFYNSLRSFGFQYIAIL